MLGKAVTLGETLGLAFAASGDTPTTSAQNIDIAEKGRGGPGGTRTPNQTVMSGRL